ncbi:MAG: M20 family metallo-hydrolase [Luteolibacter sp.]
MSPTVETALERIETLAKISDNPAYLERTFLSPANLRAVKTFSSWMEKIGMKTSHSADGTVRGILPGSDPTAPPLLLGSHIDTVIDAGKYDGALGIISSLAALENLVSEDITLPFPVHLLAFSDEEGTRFQTTYLGSRNIVEELDPETLTKTDCKGTSIATAIQTEGWHANSELFHYEPSSTRGYVELHIEQGRILEEANEPACAVSAISGQSRFLVTITGRADHAGTTPMHLRGDALTAAAECILSVEKIATENENLVATVGKIEVHPGASNSIPQSATFTIDLRDPEDKARLLLQSELEQTFQAITDKRNLQLSWNLAQQNNAVPCDETLTTLLLDSLELETGIRRILPSGAGHDGVAISQSCPIAMLFIRSRDGLSHHPDEYSTPEDIATGIAVLTRFLKSLA